MPVMTEPKMRSVTLSRTIARTAEHVGNGHPDKMADQFADGILDAVLDAARDAGVADLRDPDHPMRQRTAIEMLLKDHLVMVSGEVRMGPKVAQRVDVPEVVRRTWEAIGHQDAGKITVVNHLQVQSPELQTSSDNDGAGDQGIMVGFATDETPTFMPAEYEHARSLCMRIQEIYREGDTPWVRPDCKTQVTVGPSGSIERVVIAVQHTPEVRGATEAREIQRNIKAELMMNAVRPLFGDIRPDRVTVNGSGSFVIGGPIGDAGVVGRKIVVDSYGPHACGHGGGAYSGKDPTKVDRSAAYMARHIAKTAVAMRIKDARSVTVHLAYCIGLHQPDMISAITDAGTDISDWVKARFADLSPRAITEMLGLWRMSADKHWRYQDAAAFGHFGRDMFPWEQIAQVSD